MSNSVFPTIPGLAWPVVKKPKWRTHIQSAVSGRELRTALMSSPLWEFSLQIDVLRQQGAYVELTTLMAFFNSLMGAYDTFLYQDPTDNEVTGAQFGVGNGTRTQFQLTRTITGGSFSWVEAVQNLNGAPTIYDNGVEVDSGDYTVGSTGIITFDTAPTNGHLLTWDGDFYFRCRLLEDQMEFTNFMTGFWNVENIEFTSVKL